MIKVSILIPCFNEEKHIAQALDSVLMQETSFNYEIIICDDYSSDKSVDVISRYSEKYNNIKLIQNSGNYGNAISFYNLISKAKGEYFCVLDGDDFYTIKDKLQRQVDFLDGDKALEYVAVCHDTLMFKNENKLKLLSSTVKDFSYDFFLEYSYLPYYHTSSYLYRNIFRETSVPESFKEDAMRGDNPRTFFILKHTRGKVKALSFCGSAYRFNRKGIWGKLDIKQKKNRNLKFLVFLKDYFATSKVEVKAFDKSIKKLQKNHTQSNSFQDLDELLDKLFRQTKRIAFNQRDYKFSSLYKSKTVDSFCESIGRITLNQMGHSPLKKEEKYNNTIAIFISALTQSGGGIFYEILDILNIYGDKVNKKIYFTDVEESSLDLFVKNKLATCQNLTVKFLIQKGVKRNLSNVFGELIKEKISKAYFYKGHNNIFLNSLNQSGIFEKNICVFSFDHGFSLGLDNTSYTTYITKRIVDYQVLSKYYSEKVIFIPCWNEDKRHGDQIPYNPSDKVVITACAAARYYKLENGHIDYIDLLIDSIKKTGGHHIHYGTIPD